MSAPTKPLAARFPSREELIEWGLTPCATEGCRVVIDPTMFTRCQRCRSRR